MNEGRLRRVTAHMKEMGLEQIIVSAPASVYYLTGHWVDPHERMLALYIDASGKAILFGNAIFGLPDTPELPVVPHADSDNPVQALAKIVKPGKLGVDKFWYSKFLIGLMELHGDVQPVNGSAPVDIARMIKDEAERESLRESSRINDSVVGAVIKMLREDIAENELAAEVNRLFRQNGADCEGAQLVCFGANGADPHHAADTTRLKPGDSVIFDIFTPIRRYWCDMTRTMFYRSVSQKQREVYELVRRANEMAISQIKPGVPLCEIDRTARQIIERGGYGPQFTHRLGHGIGLDCHEPPDVSGASQLPLQAGMVFSVEPGIYLPGEFGVRIEDLVLVTPDGCEVLNRYPKELQVIE
jgi:Xaa-Pro dipeptidase